MKYISTIIFLSLGCVALCGYNRSVNRSADTTTTDASTTLFSPTNNKMCYPILSNVKMYFSDKPFTTTNTGAKTSFTSRDFIYGRIEVNGQNLAEAFKLNAQPAKGFHYLNYGILIIPKGKSENELNYDQNIKYVINNRSKPILIKAGDEKNTWLNFDVLPEPSGISTLQAPAEMPENINEFKFAAGMDLVTREDNIKTTFPSNGDYTIQLVLWNYSFDDWGKPLESEKNIITLGEFTYQFSAKDGATLMSNSQKRLDGVRLAQMMKNKYTKLPDWWHGKPFTPTDAILSSANLTPMIKNYCSHNGLTYISHKVYPYNGAAGWTIYTDSQTGRQVSRRLNAEAWTLYKDENGRCRFAVALIDEQYAGAGTYGSPYISGLSGEFIECSAIK